MTALSGLIGKIAAMLDPDPANEGKLLQWIGEARTADLPHLHSFTRGLELDISAATAAVTLPHHNGRTEGVNNINEKDQTADVRPRRLPAPHPPRMRTERHHRNCNRASFRVVGSHGPPASGAGPGAGRGTRRRHRGAGS